MERVLTAPAATATTTAAAALKPPPASPIRTNSKLRICALVSRDDVTSGGITVPVANQVHIAGATKSHSKNAFENVFGPDATQERICSNTLPELVQGVFNGQDCTFIALGGKSRGKECLLYGAPPSSAGIFQTAITSIFKITDEYRVSKPDTRYQIRMSAVQYSQRENQLTDLLSPFNSDPRRKAVKIVDDPRAGALLENESEIRVDSPDLALFYLNTVADHRVVEDEETFRTSHIFVFLSVYAYRTGTNELEGGRRRLAIVDLGLGERNSHRGELTMPAIGSILLALVQGQKHLPARENCLSQLLKCALCPSRLTTFVCSFAEKTDDNENVVQLASKLARAKRNTRKNKLLSDTASSHSSGVPRSEIESGSEVSGAETVIFMGPSPHGLHRSKSIYPPSSPSISSKLTQTSGSSGRTCTGSIPPILKGHTPFLSPSLKLYDDLCSPPGTSADGSTLNHDLTVFGGHCTQHRNDFGVIIANSPKRSKSCSLDDDKRQAIMQWVDTCEPLLSPDEDEVAGPREILSYPLEDIIEQDEESMRESVRSKCGTDSHPLSILSREDIEKIISTDATTHDAGSDEDALERAMAASVSSIRSHDIMVKLNEDIAAKEASLTATTATTPSEMDLYRRASHLEHYASEKLKEIDEDKMKKKRGKLLLNCCQNSMMSSGSTVVDWSAIEKRRLAEKEKEELEKRKNELRKRREELKIEADEIRREKEQIDKELNGRSLPSVIARQITQQLQGLSIGSKPSQKSRVPSDSLPTTPTIHKKLVSPPVRTPSLTNCTASAIPTASPSHQLKNGHPKAQWIDGMHVRKSSKSRTDRRERKLSEENRREKTSIPSPYTKVTDPRLVDGPPSSGRGSDDNASQCKEKKRQSYSASSGYESAAGDYHAAYYLRKDARFDKRKVVDKRLGLGREADNLREQQRRLKKELQEAKAIIGQVDDARAICHDTKHSGISQATLVDTLKQENRILEKRLTACRNHTMFVTTFL
ncbi:unnamed protein product [Cylicocyclus nassatus]|uniref:Kinesin motor domain-containing protein n=1 Tax=Cylicocyclus nassatus TaxID=53992 RepID=A0AA36GJF1_CYLNA|nr:unnamed protein product [Cylicocyclus nassatus]